MYTYIHIYIYIRLYQYKKTPRRILDMTRSYAWGDPIYCMMRLHRICETSQWHVCVCDMTHLHKCHYWFIWFICTKIHLIHMYVYVRSGPIHICAMTQAYDVTVFICVTYQISYVWHDSFVYVTRLIRMCEVIAPSYSWCMAFIYVIGLIHVSDMTHQCERGAPIHMCDLIRLHMSHDS